MRVIGIAGRHFCGSTILSRLMNVIPDVSSVGEVRHLQLGDKFIRCTTHGANCPVFFPENFIRPIRDYDLYEQVASACGTDTIVVSDKRVRHYNRLAKDYEFDAVILFKSIYAFAASDRRGHPYHLDQNGHEIFPPVNIQKSMKMFCDEYEKLIKWTLPEIKVFVSLERLVLHPEEQLSILSEKLGLDCPLRIPNLQDIDYCNVMGNYEGSRSPKLFLDDRWKKELSSNQKKRVTNHLRAKNVYKTLLELAI